MQVTEHTKTPGCHTAEWNGKVNDCDFGAKWKFKATSTG